MVVIRREGTFIQALQMVTQLSFTPSTHRRLTGNWKNVGSKHLGANILPDPDLRESEDSTARRGIDGIEATAHRSSSACPVLCRAGVQLCLDTSRDGDLTAPRTPASLKTENSGDRWQVLFDLHSQSLVQCQIPERSILFSPSSTGLD